jgi:hypothetical protein
LVADRPGKPDRVASSRGPFQIGARDADPPVACLADACGDATLEAKGERPKALIVPAGP